MTTQQSEISMDCILYSLTKSTLTLVITLTKKFLLCDTFFITKLNKWDFSNMNFLCYRISRNFSERKN